MVLNGTPENKPPRSPKSGRGPRPYTDEEMAALNRQHDPERCKRDDPNTCCLDCYQTYHGGQPDSTLDDAAIIAGVFDDVGPPPEPPPYEGPPPGESQPPPPARVNEDGADPHRLGRVYLWGHEKDVGFDGIAIPASEIATRVYHDEIYEFDGVKYRLVPRHEFQAGLNARIKLEFDRLNRIALAKFAAGEREGGKEPKDSDKPPVARKVTRNITSDATNAIASMTMLPGSKSMPFWIEGDGPFPARDAIAAPNGIVNLPAFVDGHPDWMIPPTRNLFTTNSLDFDFKADAPEPKRWFNLLAEVWEDDIESVETLQEIAGYLIGTNTNQQKIFLFVGPKRGGKGTIARVLTGLVGAANVAGPTLSSLGTNFGLWPLINKKLAIISDARLSGRTDVATVTERLLAISGEDGIDIDRKNLPQVHVKLPTRFMILTNELPRLNDASGALAGRMIILRMTKSWYGKEDIHLTDKLMAELPGILLWALHGWKRLRDRGHFKQPEASKELMQTMEDLSSPIGAFVRECCVVAPERMISTESLFDAWKRWCEGVGRKEVGMIQVFGRDLIAAVPSIRKTQPRDNDGGRFRAYEGIGLRI